MSISCCGTPWNSLYMRDWDLGSMNPDSWIVKNNRISAPIIATVASVGVWYASLYTISDLIFLIPVVIFFVFHFTGLWRIKLRLLGGAIVIIAFMLIAGGILTGEAVSAHQVLTYDMVHGTSKSNTNATVSVTPFASQTGPYRYDIIINSSDIASLNFSTLSVNITASGNSTPYKIITYSEMSPMKNISNYAKEFTFSVSSFPAGIYVYNVSIRNSTTVIYTTPVEGPLTASPYSIYALVVVSDYIIAVLILYVIFAVGVFLARSISKSRTPPPQTPPTNQPPYSPPPLQPPSNQ